MTNELMEYQRRLDEWHGPLLRIAQTNPIVHRFIEDYAHGRIVTREECLSQMVLALTANWTGLMNEHYQLAMRILNTRIPK